MANDIKSNLEYLKGQTSNVVSVLNNSRLGNLNIDNYESTTLCPSSEPGVLGRFYVCYGELLNKINDEMKAIDAVGDKWQTLDNVMEGKATKLGMNVTSVKANTVNVIDYDTKANFAELEAQMANTPNVNTNVTPMGNVNVQSNYPGSNKNNNGGVTEEDYLSLFKNAGLASMALSGAIIGGNTMQGMKQSTNVNTLEENRPVSNPINNVTPTNTYTTVGSTVEDNKETVYENTDVKNQDTDTIEEIKEEEKIDEVVTQEKVEDNIDNEIVKEDIEEIVDGNIEESNNISQNEENNVPDNNINQENGKNAAGVLKTIAGVGLAAGSAYGTYEYTKKLKEEDELEDYSDEELSDEEEIGGEE